MAACGFGQTAFIWLSPLVKHHGPGASHASVLHFSLRRLLLHRLKPVPKLVLRVNVTNTSGVLLNLPAQLVDCDPEALYFARVFRPPKGLQQRVMRNWLAFVEHKKA
jgi:hypothetical protein